MNIYKGKSGLNATWQEDFKENVPCVKCGKNARIIFTGVEEDRNEDFVCRLHDNGKDGKYWFHDAMAVAVYLCEKCFEATAIVNQA